VVVPLVTSGTFPLSAQEGKMEHRCDSVEKQAALLDPWKGRRAFVVPGVQIAIHMVWLSRLKSSPGLGQGCIRWQKAFVEMGLSPDG
jgi:hypothetical protein